MNVAFDPWIPVVTLSGERKLASLCSVLTEGGKYADLAVRPHERVALMRLFLCVAHAALEGPQGYDEWCEVPKRLPEVAWKYLKIWEKSFNLFHETKPWLQIAELNLFLAANGADPGDENGWSTLNKLCLTQASGNTSTLFDHASNTGVPSEYTEEEIALNLLTFQNFFVAGGKASSRMWGSFELKNPPNPKGGPCSGKSILFTFLRDKGLYKSIHLNLNTYEDLKFLYGNSGNWLGKPIWEMPISSPYDLEAIQNATQTHIGRLVPQTRMLRVNEDKKKVLLGPGFLYPKFQDEKNTFHPDLFATMVLNSEEERVLLSAKPNSAVWRELHSLIVRRKDASDKSRGSLCLLNSPDTDPCDILVCAMITNPKQAAEVIDLVESVFHIPINLRNSEGATAYESEVAQAEYWKGQLGWAVEEYRKEIDAYWEKRLEKAKQDKWALREKLYSVATTTFWTTVEKNLPLLMTHIEAIGTDAAIPTRVTWRKMLFKTAIGAYSVACGQETPRQMRAFAKGIQKLRKTKNESETDSNKIREEKE